MTFSVFLHEVGAIFPVIVAIESGRYLIAAGAMSALIWAFWRAYFRARKIQPRTASATDYRREILSSLRTTLIFAMTGFAMYLASKAGWLTIYNDFSVRGPIYFGVSLAAMIVAQDAYFYWTHRAMHHPRLFRLFHRTHHKSKTPTPWAAYAFDLPEAIVIVAFVPLWVAFVPMHDLAVFSFVTWQIVRNVMGHAGVELSPVSGKPSRMFGWLNTTCITKTHAPISRSISPGGTVGWEQNIPNIRRASRQSRTAVACMRRRLPAHPWRVTDAPPRLHSTPRRASERMPRGDHRAHHGARDGPR